MPTFYNPYTNPPKSDPQTFDPSERRTSSEFAEDCDINTIVARYQSTGQLPDQAKAAAGRFGDFSQVPSYDEMYQKVIAAQEMFAALPAEVRKEFNNDPGLFVASADTPQGRDRLIELGLGESLPDKAPEAILPSSSSSSDMAVKKNDKKSEKLTDSFAQLE